MSDNITLKVVSFHLPLLRAPLILNNIIALVFSGLTLYHGVCIAELIFLIFSTSLAIVDLAYYLKRRHISRHESMQDQRITVYTPLMLADAALMFALLIIWLVGVIFFFPRGGWGWQSSTEFARVATVGALLAWLSHLTSFCAELLLWIQSRQKRVVCPHCRQSVTSIAGIPRVEHHAVHQKAAGLPSGGDTRSTTDLLNQGEIRLSEDTVFNDENEDGEDAQLLPKDILVDE